MPGSMQKGFITLKVIKKTFILCLCPREFPHGLYEYNISFSGTPCDVGTAIYSHFQIRC